MILRSFAVAAGAAAVLAVPADGRAELVTLASGRTMSVRAVEVSGDSATLTLRGGGTMTCAASQIVRIAPDEVGRGGIGRDGVGRDGIGRDGSPSRPPRPTDPNHATPSQTAQQSATPATPPKTDTWGATARAYEAVIAKAARQYDVDPKLVHAVIAVESGYRPRARSPRGALGMMQLMPATARELRVRNPMDAAANIDGGVRYLRQLLDRFELRLALAAYNAGAAAVERYGGIPPYPETRAYVARVLRLAGAS